MSRDLRRCFLRLELEYTNNPTWARNINSSTVAKLHVSDGLHMHVWIAGKIMRYRRGRRYQSRRVSYAKAA